MQVTYNLLANSTRKRGLFFTVVLQKLRGFCEYIVAAILHLD